MRQVLSSFWLCIGIRKISESGPPYPPTKQNWEPATRRSREFDSRHTSREGEISRFILRPYPVCEHTDLGFHNSYPGTTSSDLGFADSYLRRPGYPTDQGIDLVLLTTISSNFWWERHHRRGKSVEAEHSSLRLSPPRFSSRSSERSSWIEGRSVA